jgi:hypothetical protein
MTLATTAALPVLRGPVQLARTLAAIDILSGGRLVVGVGPGSSADDYAAVGIGYQERWRRFDEAVRVLRALLHGDPVGFEGEFHSTPRGPAGAAAGAAARPADLGGELGLAGRVAAGRAPGRRLAGLGLQHHAGPVPRGPGPARRGVGPRGQGAGARRVFVWPLADELRQLELFRERVTRLVPRQPSVRRA